MKRHDLIRHLRQHGYPERAEFIRVQCRLNQIEDIDAEKIELEDHAQQLLSCHGKRWVHCEFPAEYQWFGVMKHIQVLRDAGLINTQRRHWLEQIAGGEARLEDDPHPLGAVVRVSDAGGRTLDLRSGLVAETMPDAKDWRTFLLVSLRCPPELSP